MEYHYIKINGKDVLNPGDLCEAAERHGFSVNFWGRANSIMLSAGMHAAPAWLVVSRQVAEELETDITHTIVWTWRQEGEPADRVVTFSDWVLTRATIMGLDGDENAPYLLEFRDKRFLMKDSETIQADYNVTLGWVSAAKLYWPDSLDGGTDPWTWQTLLDDLWTYLPSLAGTSPTLVWTPPHDPENWRFDGISAWDAIGQILAACQSTLTSVNGGFNVVSFGEEDENLAGFFNLLRNRLIEDGKPLYDLDEEVTPETFRVLFAIRTGEPDDSEYNKQEVASGLAWATSGYVVDLWSDLLGEPGINSATLLNNSDITASGADIAARAALRWSTPAVLKRYSGLHADPRDPAAEDEEDRPTFPFTIGPAVHQILIRDYGDGDGLCTEIRTRRDLVRPESVSRQPPFPRELPWVTPHNCLQLKNNSGGNLVPGRVLEVGDKLYSEPTRWGAFFDGNVPDPDGADNVAVNLRRMDTSGSTNIDWCQIYGLVKCKLIVNHIQHVYADVDASSTILQSKWHGRARIVWVSDPGNTGEQDAWVLLGEMFRGPIKGIATEDIPECGSGDVKVQWAGEDADPLSTVEVHYNWMSLGTIAAGTELLFEWFPDEQKYVVVELACSPTSCA